MDPLRFGEGIKNGIFKDFDAVGHSLYQCALQSSLKVWWNFKNSVTLNVRHK